MAFHHPIYSNDLVFYWNIFPTEAISLLMFCLRCISIGHIFVDMTG
jgi:hypothetical protein